MNKKFLLISLIFLLVACTNNDDLSSPTGETRGNGMMGQMNNMPHHEHSPEEHMMGMHSVPAEADEVMNPVEATEESMAIGAEIFAGSCAVCHGESGEGDGTAAASMNPKPANLHQNHVQMLSDGALFYIISHGKPSTPMPAWDKVLTEEERWHVVNFLRTFQDE